MAKLARHKLVKCSSNDTYEQLAEMAKQTKVPIKEPKALKLADIHVAPKVFQWRRRGRNVVESEFHTLELARALQDAKTPFPPLLVFLIGERFYVLDGHHRLDAYHSVGWAKSVPVKLFLGTLEEARTTALKLNSRNKLPMTREDKSEAAWELTKTAPHLSIATVHELSTVSPRTVSYMRSGWKTICEQANGKEKNGEVWQYGSVEDMKEKLSWAKARMALSGIKFPDNADWREAEVDKMTKLLLDSVGYKLMRNPDITAQALRNLSPDLPRALIHEWSGEERETIKELAEYNEEEIPF
jgi:hypothetical protein